MSASAIVRSLTRRDSGGEARLNEAAGAADASAWVILSIGGGVSCGSQGGSCDPTSSADAG